MKKLWKWIRAAGLWFMGKYYSHKINRIKSKAIKAMQSIDIYDAMLKSSGYSRQQRKQFWRDVVKHPSLAGEVAEKFKEMGK
ncbi:MAG: hypothetical protein KAU20_03255 [Nanoarchaeota archaeon]|nr:hypothetical protein [Nanoarchaeota archaeon]